MTNFLTWQQEILDKAVVKAMANGWRPIYNDVDYSTAKREVGPSDITWVGKADSRGLRSRVYTDYPRIIFNHDFAKALWGEARHEERIGNWDEVDKMHSVYSAEWQYHLQQMVLAEDPREYLKDNLYA